MKRAAASLLLTGVVFATCAAWWPGVAAADGSVEVTQASGRVVVRVTLTDSAGAPVAGVAVDLIQRIQLFGAMRDEILDRSMTNALGKASLTFVPIVGGGTNAIVRFAGAPGLAASATPITFDVPQPMAGLHAGPPGIAGPFAHAAWILLPLAAVWVTYMVVARLAIGLWRAGRSEGTSSTAIAPSLPPEPHTAAHQTIPRRRAAAAIAPRPPVHSPNVATPGGGALRKPARRSTHTHPKGGK